MMTVIKGIINLINPVQYSPMGYNGVLSSIIIVITNEIFKMNIKENSLSDI